MIRRTEDMSPDGYLELLQEDDGDIIVIVREGGDEQHERGFGAQVQFCTSQGGGHSHHTWMALVELMRAMERDAHPTDETPSRGEG